MRDVTVIGAGPAGLAAAFWAGMREASVRVVDALPAIGGQLTALYPEKPIYDVVSQPRVLARELVERHAEQTLDQVDVELLLSTTITGMRRADDRLVLETSDGRALETRAVVLAVGHGAVEPRSLPELDLHDWVGRGVAYVVPPKEQLRGKRVVLVGGGDSAVDWALDLIGVAAEVHLVHRRERFRALDASVSRLRAAVMGSQVVLHAPKKLPSVVGGDRVEAVVLDDGSQIACDWLLPQLGFTSSLDAFAGWGLELGRGGIVVDPATMATSVPGVWACGDAAAFGGKLKLIATGYGEAATAIAQAVRSFRPEEQLQPSYSTDTGVPAR